MPLWNGILVLYDLKRNCNETRKRLSASLTVKRLCVKCFLISALSKPQISFTPPALFPILPHCPYTAVYAKKFSLPNRYPTSVTEPATEDFIFIKTDGKIFKSDFEDLLFAEAKGNNTKIVLIKNTLSTVMTFSNFEELLPKTKFFRLHRSFIINKSKITHIKGNRVFIGQIEIPIGSHYKEDFLKGLGV